MSKIVGIGLVDMVGDGIEKQHELEVVKFADLMIGRLNQHGENAGTLPEKTAAELLTGLSRQVAQVNEAIWKGEDPKNACVDLANYACAIHVQIHGEVDTGASDEN